MRQDSAVAETKGLSMALRRPQAAYFPVRDLPVALTPRQREVAQRLMKHEGWARPRDIGGRDAATGSRVAQVLWALARRGLVERRRRKTLGGLLGHPRAGFEYRWLGKRDDQDRT